MINFNQALFNLVKAGKVNEQEALSKASNPQALEMNLREFSSTKVVAYSRKSDQLPKASKPEQRSAFPLERDWPP